MDPPESFCSSLNCKFHVILQNDQFRVRMFQSCRNNLPELTPMPNQMPQKHPAILPVKAVLQFFRYNVPTTDILVFFYLLKLHVQEVFLIGLLRMLAEAEPQTATYHLRELSNIHHGMLVPHLDQDRQEEFSIELHTTANLCFSLQHYGIVSDSL